MRTSGASIFFMAGLLAGTAAATVTNATVSIGGLGGFTSCGAQNPPVICDGVTPATADVEFEYNDGVSPPTLSLTVANTSPVTAGVANPLITNIYFNVPLGTVSNLTLVSGPPGWSLVYDADLAVNPNPNGADGMGAYNAQLTTGGGTANGIGNPLADTYCIPVANVVVGPVKFDFTVTLAAGGATINAGSFATAFSVIPPGQKKANVTIHFQAGGPNCDSGFITNGPDCTPGSFATGTTPPDGAGLGDVICFTMSGSEGCEGCLTMSLTGNGPTVFPQPPFPDLVIPLTPPVVVILSWAYPNNNVSNCIQVPNDPNLLGLVAYFSAILVDEGTGQFFASAGFSLTVVP